MNIQKVATISLVLLTLGACKKTGQAGESTAKLDSTTQELKPIDSISSNIKTEAVADDFSQKIEEYLNNNFLTEEDKKVIKTEERKFSYHQVDLNNDTKKETFVYLDSPYFCGTGGCTILLLSSDMKLINKFTVTNPPIYVEPSLKNDWKILTVKSGNEWKELDFSNGKYPSNPSILKKAPYDAPSGHAELIFGETDKVKIFKF